MARYRLASLAKINVTTFQTKTFYTHSYSVIVLHLKPDFLSYVASLWSVWTSDYMRGDVVNLAVGDSLRILRLL